MTIPWTVVACAQFFWLGMLIYYSRKWRRLKNEMLEEADKKAGWLMKAQYARNVSDARLSMIRQEAVYALKGLGTPYRSGARTEPLDTLTKIRELVDVGMVENCREVGHFRDLMEATEFLNTLPAESNAYCFLHRMWDGDCYHVVYSHPAPTEIPPPGKAVLK